MVVIAIKRNTGTKIVEILNNETSKCLERRVTAGSLSPLPFDFLSLRIARHGLIATGNGRDNLIRKVI